MRRFLPTKSLHVIIAFSLLALAAISLRPAQAASDDEIIKYVKELYNAELVRDAEPFSARLLALHEAAMAKSMELMEPVSGLDFDYVINGQDFSETAHSSATFEVISKSEERAEVKVNFLNFEPQELIYTMVPEEGGWWIDEVVSKTPGYEWTLSELLKEGAK
jgi:hypothetical protein